MAIPDSVASLLLKINSDTDDGRQGLEEMAAALKAFGGIKEEARADIETDRGERNLRDLADSLKRFGTEDADAQAGVDIARGVGSLTELNALLTEYDHTSVDADLDVDTTGAMAHLLAFKAFLSRATGDANIFTRALGGTVEKAGQLGEVLAPDALRLGAFTFSLSQAGAVLPVIITLLVAVVAAVGALAASLGAAVAGLGALAIAAAGVLGPAVGIVVAGIFRFKETVDKAGTAAHQLAAGIQGLMKPLQALLPAADPALKALVGGLDNVKRLITAIRPAFMQFGSQAGSALTIFIDQLTSGPMRAGIADLIKLAGRTLPALARIFGNVAEIVFNIARAAMPFLTNALKDVAGALDPIASGSRNIDQLRQAIQPLIGQLRSWLSLLGAISNMFIQIGQVAAGPGRGLVKWLTDAAQGIADWANSAEGTSQIENFLNDTLPLFKSLVDVIAQVGLAFLQLGQLLAPILTPFINALTDVLKILNDVLAFINGSNIGDALGKLFILPLGPLGPLIAGIKNVLDLLRDLMPLLPDLGQAFEDAFSFIKDIDLGSIFDNPFSNDTDKVIAEATKVAIADGVGNAAQSGVVKRAGGQVSRAVTLGFVEFMKRYRPRVFQAGKEVGQAAVEAMRTARQSAQAAGRVIGNAFQEGVKALRNAASQAGKTVAQAAEQAMKALHSAANQAGRLIGGAFVQGLHAVQSAAQSAGRAVGNAATTGMRILSGAAHAAGAAFAQNFAQGIVANIGAIAAAAARAAQAARDKLPGSEPRDHTSPLYGLGDSGAAIVDNLARGITKRSGALAAALSDGLVLDLPNNMKTSDPVLKDLAARFAGEGKATIEQNIYTLHPGDPRVLREVASAANRGNSLRMTMPVLRKNING